MCRHFQKTKQLFLIQCEKYRAKTQTHWIRFAHLYLQYRGLRHCDFVSQNIGTNEYQNKTNFETWHLDFLIFKKETRQCWQSQKFFIFISKTLSNEYWFDNVGLTVSLKTKYCWLCIILFLSWISRNQDVNIWNLFYLVFFQVVCLLRFWMSVGIIAHLHTNLRVTCIL